jgi:hypothetical protein
MYQTRKEAQAKLTLIASLAAAMHELGHDYHVQSDYGYAEAIYKSIATIINKSKQVNP